MRTGDPPVPPCRACCAGRLQEYQRSETQEPGPRRVGLSSKTQWLCAWRPPAKWQAMLQMSMQRCGPEGGYQRTMTIGWGPEYGNHRDGMNKLEQLTSTSIMHNSAIVDVRWSHCQLFRVEVMDLAVV
eukprot:353182-Chlamydomonas_euryale.AAC.11